MASGKLASFTFAAFVGVAAAAALTMPTDSMARPAIEIRVDIKAQSLTGLPQREFVQREVARTVAERFRDRYRLFAWSPGQGAKVATLVARVTQSPALPLPTVDVDWVLEIPGQGDYVLHIEPARVYDSSDMRRALTEPDIFKSDLEKVIREVLKEAFFDRFRDEVLQRIPIARDAMPIPEDRMISVPLVWTEAQLSSEAVLRVLFERKEGDATKRGSFDIGILNERTVAPGKGLIQGGIQGAMWDTGKLPMVAGWNALVPSLLQGASITCHIATFKESVGGSSPQELQLRP